MVMLERSKDGVPAYKQLLRARLESLKTAGKARFTNEKLALALRIEPAYLSRCLNHSQHHPSRDLLFRIAHRIGMTALECEQVLTYFDYELALNEDHRRHLRTKLRLASVFQQFRSIPDLRAWIEIVLGDLGELRSLFERFEKHSSPGDSLSPNHPTL
jgi:hypothetical protein